MDEGGEDNSLSEAPTLSATQFVLTRKPTEEVIRVDSQLGPKEAVEAVAELPAQITGDSIKVGTDPGNVQAKPECDMWTPTLREGSPQTLDNLATASSAELCSLEGNGFGPGYEHPYWALLHEAGYTQW